MRNEQDGSPTRRSSSPIAFVNRQKGRHIRYGLATLGPVCTAGSQFILTLQLLHALSPQSFGSFSFLLIASNLSTGLSSALLCAPLPILLSKCDEKTRADILHSIQSANIFMVTSAVVVFYFLGIALHIPSLASALLSGYAALILFRWFARAFFYTMDVQWRTVASDLVYGLVLLAGSGGMALHGISSLTLPCAVLISATALSLLPFGVSYLFSQSLHFSISDFRRYRTIWQKHSSWSLLGVLTTEGTANAQAYIVTFISGPAVFASVAASALLTRPVIVAINALGEFERPQLARLVANGPKESVRRPMLFFRIALLIVWLGTACASILLMFAAPRLVFPARYGFSDLAIGASLWFMVAAIRLLRVPESTLLQAVGLFRPLAYATVVSSFVSILAVTGFLARGGPIWSIVGILAGETTCAIIVWFQAKRWANSAV